MDGLGTDGRHTVHILDEQSYPIPSDRLAKTASKSINAVVQIALSIQAISMKNL